MVILHHRMMTMMLMNVLTMTLAVAAFPSSSHPRRANDESLHDKMSRVWFGEKRNIQAFDSKTGVSTNGVLLCGPFDSLNAHRWDVSYFQRPRHSCPDIVELADDLWSGKLSHEQMLLDPRFEDDQENVDPNTSQVTSPVHSARHNNHFDYHSENRVRGGQVFRRASKPIEIVYKPFRIRD